MKSSITRGIDTRRLYKFEAMYFRGTQHAKCLPMKTLRALARRVWIASGQTGVLPTISAGRGTRHGHAWFSYSQGDYIQLSRNQRNALVLMHELVHAMGYDDHDAEFASVHIKMLAKFLPMNHATLCAAAREFGVG